MRRRLRKAGRRATGLILSLFLLAALCAPGAAAEPTPPPAPSDMEPEAISDREIVPVIAGIKASQAGDSRIFVTLRGREMPLPAAVSAPGDAKLVLRWNGARFARNADKRDWWESYEWSILKLTMNPTETWWKEFLYPLLERVNAAPIDESSLTLTFTGPKPLAVEEVRGVAGADEMTLVLKTYEPPKPTEAPKPAAVPAKGDPMAIKAPVSLQVKDADVKSLFWMLADAQKLNLLLDASVPEMTVTVSFKDMPFNEAFAYLLRMTDLTYALQGKTLLIGKAESIGKTLGKEIVRGYRLAYAVDDAGTVRNELTGVLAGLVSLSKPPTLDPGTRTLYVTATPDQHEQVRAILEKLDHPGRQVMLQAQIVEVNSDSRQELEALVSAVYDQWLVNFTGDSLNAGYNYINGALEGSGLTIPVQGFPTGDGTTAVISGIHVNSGVKALTAGLNALENNNKAKVLANPSVIAIDAQEARVELTREFVYVSGRNSDNEYTFSEVSVGPTLIFTPVIGREGVITIKVSVETGELIAMRSAGNGVEAPETSSRRVETVVRVRNGEPFAVGGLYQEYKTKDRGRIPVLGYIPLLGDLFTRRLDRHTKSEVAMIVVPYLLDVPEGEIDTFDLQQPSLLK